MKIVNWVWKILQFLTHLHKSWIFCMTSRILSSSFEFSMLVIFLTTTDHQGNSHGNITRAILLLYNFLQYEKKKLNLWTMTEWKSRRDIFCAMTMSPAHLCGAFSVCACFYVVYESRGGIWSFLNYIVEISYTCAKTVIK